MISLIFISNSINKPSCHSVRDCAIVDQHLSVHLAAEHLLKFAAVGAIGYLQIGVGDIIEKNYRQPIYRNFSNYRQIIDIEFWEFGNYRKIIDIENCIQFYPINTIESIVLKTRKGPQ